ncbi:MAG: aminotransferase class IV [Ghiorsea sp.]|nr:aminotransferase class IV [Ghiorsea sp.]
MADDLNIQHIHSLDRGLSYAESCFETFRVVDKVIFSWDYHWQRLQGGLQSFGMILTEKHQQYIEQQCLNAAKDKADDCLVRLTISGGNARWGLQQRALPNIYIQAQAFQAKTTEIHLKCVEYPFPLMPKIAKFSADYALSLRAAQGWGLADINTALVCKDGVLLGGMTANIALLVDGQWLSPEGEGVLSGTIRHFLLQQGLIHAQTCPISLLKHSQAAVLLNSGSFLQAIHSIDCHSLNIQHPELTNLKQHLRTQKGIYL